MLKKGKLWFADWNDPQGKRRRKGFTTQKKAAQHQAKMRSESAAKKAPRSAA